MEMNEPHDGLHSGEFPDALNGGKSERSLVGCRRILLFFLYGQLVNVMKAAIWWSTFGVVMTSILDNDLALSLSRGFFNLALLMSSPLAASSIQHMSLKKLLLVTTSLRLIIWSIFLPMVVLSIDSVSFSTSATSLSVLMFLDGVQVAFSNSADIDCGGLDLLAHTYQLPLTDFVKYRYASLHQIVFDAAFILFTPPFIFSLLQIDQHLFKSTAYSSYSNTLFNNVNKSVIVLVGGVSLLFALFSCFSLYFYATGIPANGSVEKSRQISQDEVSRHYSGDLLPSPALRDSSSLLQSYRSKFSQTVDGLIIVMETPFLKSRLFLLATETALEDAMVSVFVPIISFKLTEIIRADKAKSPDLLLDPCLTAFISVLIIAVGKIGGVMAALSSNLRTVKSENLAKYVIASSFSLLLVVLGFHQLLQPPLSPNQPPNQPSNQPVDLLYQSQTNYQLSQLTFNAKESIFSGPYCMEGDGDGVSVCANDNLISHWISMLPSTATLFPYASIGLGVFLFFLFSTAPKIGFASLLQNAVGQDGNEASKVFAFVGLFVTIVDALLIIAINLVFHNFASSSFIVPLGIVVSLYMAHALAGAYLCHEKPRSPTPLLVSYPPM